MSDPRSAEDRTSETKAVVDAYYKAYETGLHERLMPLLHEQHRYYPPGGGKAADLAQRLEEAKLFFAAFSDVEISVCDQIVDGSRAAMRIRMSATHSGNFHGLKATGRSVVMSYMEFVRVEAGRILEDWAEFDIGTILRQIS